jgi:hypothetical protein
VSFSARQQQCLEAMGIVPWVAKSESLSIVSERATFVPSSMPENVEELKL